MGIKLKDFLDPRVQNPISAYKDASDHGGDPLKAVLDPQGIILDSGPRNTKEARAAQDKYTAKKKKKRLAKSRAAGANYAKGGRTKMKHSKNHTNCRGMGCATRGGKFRKDG
jgi:hypothetical protein